jgi:hypothetical protein
MKTTFKSPAKLFGLVTVPDYPLIYLNIPKAACTTIKNQLYFMQFGEYSDNTLDIHSDPKLLRAKTSKDFFCQTLEKHLKVNHLIFTFVKDPGLRAYSLFIEKFHFLGKHSFGKIRNYVQSEYGAEFPEAHNANVISLDQHVANFIAYLNFVEDNINGLTNVRNDPHWLNQTQLLKKFRQHLKIDFIGNVETFSTDFDKVLDNYHGPYRPNTNVRFNEGPPAPFSFTDVNCADVTSRLIKIYEQDYIDLKYAVPRP